ncbi:T9SS type A sorting domain-containing protein [Flavobacterium sp.]|uniref:T9SS type A sorting domain-containing protein n=1 Tax=Flavobacterium sp. TaxID=239 RepID=UPI002B4AEB37|nr:T9SS type A sorting domain-containing protein [Flavobacterium sp.]HLP64425.1 T9SS type A sorting domain-containing protein [Flavobacterium sp.]
MKKNYLIASLVMLLTTLQFNAQVVNGNFENIKPNFLPSNWGMNLSLPVVIDTETGETTSDNIQFTWCIPALCYVSYEPHTGQTAMEISNAFNQTQNKVIPGEAMIFSDATQDSPGWNPGVPIEPGMNVQTLGFFYKFFPAGNDVAEAKLTVFDAEGNEIGTASVEISGTNSQYSYVYSYIDYTSNAQPAYMYISFNMAKEGSTPTFGSRLIIDNVVTNFQALDVVLNTTPINTDFAIAPTVVDQEINIIPASNAVGIINYKIFNMEGRLVKEANVENTNSYVYSMNIDELNSGVYFLQIDSNLGTTTKKIIKK